MLAIYNAKGQPLACCALIEIASDAAVGDSPRISHFALVSQVSVDRAEVDNWHDAPGPTMASSSSDSGYGIDIGHWRWRWA